MVKFDVDYPHVRQNADIVAVLAHYNVSLKGEGEQRKGLCPFHDDTQPSLNVNTGRNLFKCHACGSGGNIIKLLQLLDPAFENPRKAALQVAELSGIAAKPDGPAVPSQKTAPKPVTRPTATVSAEPDKSDTETTEGVADKEMDGVLYNRPLTFKLQLDPIEEGGHDAAHLFVDERGLPYQRLSDLGIGVARRGSMANRLAIPIYNQDSLLVAYCGRDIGLLQDPEEPKYKFPAKFRKDFELYGWEVAQYFDRVVIVESFLTVIKHGGEASKFGEAGFGVASVMGTSISREQIELLAATSPEVIVCFDGDDHAREAAQQVAGQIANAGLWVKVQNSADGEKPHMYNIDDFCRVFGKV